MFHRLLLVFSVLILSGFIDSHFLEAVSTISVDLFHSRKIVDLLFISVLFAPLVPLGAVGIVSLTSIRLRYWQAAILSAFFGITGGCLSVINAAFAGGGATAALFHGVALTIAVIAPFLIMVGQAKTKLASKIGICAMAVPAAVACWSIAHGFALAINAHTISDGKPYCIARHGEKISIHELIDLRGLSFYTTKSGFKNSQSWYFHGVLLVDIGGDVKVYNWSMTRMRFEPLPNLDRLLDNPASECVPRTRFLETVPFMTYASKTT